MANLKNKGRWATIWAAAGLLVLPGVAIRRGAHHRSDEPRLGARSHRVVRSGHAMDLPAGRGDVQCTGELANTWESQPGPDDWCSQPLFSVDGRFERRQTRYYAFDPATGNYLETNRLIHLDAADSLVSAPDAPASGGVSAVLRMTWVSTFDIPGDLDSRVTRKQGIDTWFQAPHGGVFILDVGQKKTIFSDDFDLHGRWDIALGDGAAEFSKVCTALGLT